jgi:GT2 family glycosyltransferase
MPDKVSLVIVHWNTADILEQQLKLVYCPDFQITLINNNPKIDLSSLKKKFPKLELIQNDFNRGFAFACNQGVSLAEHDWIFFLNPDVLIEPYQIEEMIKDAKQSNLDALSPRPSNTAYAKPIPSPLSLLVEFTPIGRIIPSFVFGKKTLTGGALLIKKTVIRAVGGWDERFFLWFEDSDLTKRLLKAGYKTGFSLETVRHIGGTSFENWADQKKRDIFFHSLKVYADKHFAFVGRKITTLIKSRYSKRKLLPILNQGLAITVPNIKLTLLENFFKKNLSLIDPINELIIVTSALNKEKYWQLKKEYPQLRIILLDKNKGFAKTVNIGFRVSLTPWLVTVNDDVLLNKGVLEICIKEAVNKTGAINPIIKNPDGRIESAGIKILKKGKATTVTELPTKEISQTDVCNAACVLYNNQALNQVGLFDEKFGSYLEDIDLSLRIGRAGWRNIVNSKVEIIHLKHQSSKYFKRKKNYLDFKNWCLVVKKNWTLFDKIIYAPQILIERLRNFYGVFK